jgi:hypothetical protein
MCEVPDFPFGNYAEDSKTFTVYSKSFLIWSAWDQKLGSELSSPPSNIWGGGANVTLSTELLMLC